MSVDEKLLMALAEAAARANLEFILIGNAGAALQAAPVTTEDFDLFVRHTPRNLEKIKAVGNLLGGSVSQPYPPSPESLRPWRRMTRATP